MSSDPSIVVEQSALAIIQTLSRVTSLLLILSSAVRRLINFADTVLSDPMMSAIPSILATALTKLNSQTYLSTA